MSDIVERLRSAARSSFLIEALYDEAADEIERLRAENARLIKENEGWKYAFAATRER